METMFGILERQKVVSGAMWSLFADGLYLWVIYIAFLGGSIFKWSL